MSDQANYQLPIHTTDDSSSTIDVTDVPTTLNEKDLADQPLQPPDGGRGWLVVFGSFLYRLGFIFHVGLSVILKRFGYNYSWGVFLNYYNKNVYVGQLATLSWIGSICVSLFFFLGPVNRLVIAKMGYRNMLIVGNIICPVALILASFAYEVWHVFLTQGVLFGLGASFIWFPCIGASQQWFSERRGLAIGLAMSGSGIGGLVVANIAQAAISNLGYRWALRIIGIMAFVLLLVTTATVRPLGHIKQTGGQDQIIAWYLFKNPQFVVIFLHGLITTFGYMTPFFLLPAYANSLGLDPWIGTNLSAIMSGINAVARIFTGFLGDKVGRFNSLFICTMLCGLTCLVIWIPAKSEAGVWIFAVLYGFFGGGYVALFPTVQPQVVGLENISPAVGLLYATNFFGYLFGTPIASKILETTSNYTYAAAWAGSTVMAGGLLAGVLRVQRAGWKLVKV
ncbi:hypothetical protein NQZ79_g3966 [Umbelopsis isabellina]|nr:hypothetical protein NQZ79_g3966 [Umbelopsis isabellina]